jgi:hypothetical protein
LGDALLGDLISNLFSHPKFKGSHTPRPGAIWDEHGGFQPHADILGALDLPSGGCEFGACNFQNGQGGGSSRTPYIDPDDARILALAIGINKRAGSLNSVCFVPAFYATSATIAAGGVAVANSGEIVAAASEEYPSLVNKTLAWFQRVISRPARGPGVVTMTTIAATQVSQFCKSH